MTNCWNLIGFKQLQADNFQYHLSYNPLMFFHFVVLKATEQAKVVKTLPPVLDNFVNSDDSPRRGAIYVWSKFVNPFKFDGFNEK